MRFGVCCSLDDEERVKIAAESGFDYIESGFQMFANATEDQLKIWEEREKKYNILCESVNCFLPGSLPVCSDADWCACRSPSPQAAVSACHPDRPVRSGISPQPDAKCPEVGSYALPWAEPSKDSRGWPDRQHLRW